MSRFRLFGAVLVALFAVTLLGVAASACTRCLHRFGDGRVIVGRSMDWMEDPSSEIWCFPQGMKRHGNAGPASLEWTSKYGSVAVSFYGVATVDGMNEKGLVANTLYLAESDYGKPVTGRRNLSIGGWAQYVLDSYATVAEAVEDLRKEPFTILAPVLPNGEAGVGHLAISDSSGDSAIVEYVAGRLVIHHSRDYTVMTNSPPYDQQLALNAYWKQIGGDVMLPGTVRASDRFVRASFYVDSIPKETTGLRAIAAVFSVIRNASAPLGITTPGKPNVASTIWRTVHDQKERVLYFDSATSPTVFWIPLERLDFTAGAAVKRLPLKDGETYNGDASGSFRPGAAFTFLEAKP
ncbi:MAG: linear amide C-N hydrolase [Planctomycetota bacterium]|nr:MAG: linear amide C-N hydrolase [Planctomycetota bacterium]